MDEESGLIYLRARYYNPDTGRFTQEDPAKDGTNWYAYAGNNPIHYSDPAGFVMDGDNELSEGAQIYTNYYGSQWEKSKENYDTCVAAGDTVGALAAQQEMEDWHDKAEDISKLDSEGKIKAILYDVPLYAQGYG